MLDLAKLREAIRYEGGVSRRLFMAYASALAATPLLGSRVEGRRVASFASNPFSLGVASGDPTDTGVALWSRLAPKPLEADGGMPATPVEVRWELAEDDGMKRVLRQGSTTAAPDLAHSIHVEVDGLQPDRWYWYRFRAGDAESPIGRTRTLPAPTTMPDELNFAFASCQHYEAGYFTGYDHMAKDNLDLMIHLGDYIYEGAAQKGKVRQHIGGEIKTLTDYRIRHSLYRSDPMLQAMHARCPWLVTWDDHEVSNNYAADHSEKPNVKTADFLVRRAAAYQAYYEMMPLRAASLPRGGNMQLYRKASFGRLAKFLVLDTRQYRSVQPHGGKRGELDASALDPASTMLGARQATWMKSSLTQSQATWNVLAQQVMMGLVHRTTDGKEFYAMDQWPGYAHERMELVRFMAERKIRNPVVLTGDIHSNWANNLRVDDRKPEMPVVASEFVGTSMSSGGDGVEKIKGHDQILAENPCVKFFNGERGYVRCKVKPGIWRSDYQVIDTITKPGGKQITRASFVVENGKPGPQKA